MCLKIDMRNGFEAPVTDIAWKIVQYKDGIWRTPIRGSPIDITSGKLVAKGCIEISNRRLSAGAIHCYKYKRMAQKCCFIPSEIVIKVKGIKHVAHNDTEIAYKEIQWKPFNLRWAKIKIFMSRCWLML